MKKIIWIIAAVLILGIGFYLYKQKTAVPQYETEPVQKGKISSVIEVTGKINPKVMVDIGCQVTGKIQKIYVDFNARVKKGQLLAEIDPTLYKADVDSNTASVNQAREQLSIKKMAIEKSKEDISRKKELIDKYYAIMVNKKKTFDRYTTLLQKNLISQSDKDSAEADYVSSLKDYNDSKLQLSQSEIDYRTVKTQYSVAENDIEKARIALNKAQANLGYTDIISPVDGIVVAKLFEEGQTVVSTYQTSTLFKVATDLRKMQILCSISESDIASIKDGQKVTFNVDAYSGKEFEGKVVQIRIQAKEENKAVYYDVVVDVDNKDLMLMPGMTADADIVTLSKDNVLKVSNKALRFIPKAKDLQEKLKQLRTQKSNMKTGEGQTPGVLWTMKGKSIEPVNVSLGISDGKFTELAEGVLKENDLVVIGEKDKKKK